MAGVNRDEVKVVLIDTQYVVTDPRSFKSVVQRLTGKDSCVEWIEESSFAGTKRKRSPVRNVNYDGALEKNSSDHHGAAGVGGGGNWRGFSKGLSFKDLDKMLLELPPLEEWHQLWAQNNLV